MLGRAIEKCGIENEIATFLKRKFDEKYGGSWQCIVGRNFGIHLECIEFIHMYISKISILLYRCSINCQNKQTNIESFLY
ncbi:dynein light chain type 1 [Dictyocaulus viviparus]|uniref:Dynein light chain n=1 Tax=Dictyocaulus viviparus TaxID=29172 RepID=A0A0D8XM86_DICVI|nr:dynein light chain type 1 [Dictyocaulus viviparus]